MTPKLSLNQSLKQSLFENLQKINIKTINQIHLASKEMQMTFFPKKSKTLVKNFQKLIFSIDDPLHLTIRSHLYAEIMLNAIIQKNFKKPEKIINTFSFLQKIQLLYALGKLDNNLFADLIHLNKLRNNFAHNLRYDISEFNFSQFSDLNDVYKKKDYRQKSAKRVLNLLLFKFEMLFILGNMTDQFREILLIDA